MDGHTDGTAPRGVVRGGVFLSVAAVGAASAGPGTPQDLLPGAGASAGAGPGSQEQDTEDYRVSLQTH